MEALERVSTFAPAVAHAAEEQADASNSDKTVAAADAMPCSTRCPRARVASFAYMLGTATGVLLAAAADPPATFGDACGARPCWRLGLGVVTAGGRRRRCAPAPLAFGGRAACCGWVALKDLER